MNGGHYSLCYFYTWISLNITDMVAGMKGRKKMHNNRIACFECLNIRLLLRFTINFMFFNQHGKSLNFFHLLKFVNEKVKTFLSATINGHLLCWISPFVAEFVSAVWFDVTSVSGMTCFSSKLLAYCVWRYSFCFSLAFRMIIIHTKFQQTA